MPTIPDGYAQTNFIFGGAALPFGAEVTLASQVEGDINTPAELAEFMANAWSSEILGGQSSNITFLGTRVKFGPSETGPSAEFALSSPGGAASTTVSPNTAYLVRKLTALGGRAGRGRMYVPGPNETTINAAGQVEPATLEAQQDNWDAFFDGLALLNVTPVLLHGDGAPLTTPTPITSFSVDGRVATQRRRLRR